MKHSVDFAVLRGGVIGSATAYMLSKSGRSTALIEQFEIGHNRGSSHGESRITRLSYDHPVYVKMAKRTFELWAEVEKDAATQLYFPTGGIDIGPPGDSRLEACKSSMDSEGVPYEEIDRAEILRRYPQFNLKDNACGVVQETTGILSASLCVNTLSSLATKHGTLMLTNTEVRKVTMSGGKVLLESESCSVEANHLIICAGSWSGPLLQTLGVSIPLVVSLEQWAFFAAERQEDFMPGKFPIFIQYDGVGSGGIGWYGFPIFGQPGVKTSVHRSGPPTTAQTRSFEPDAARLADLQARMKTIIPGAAGEIFSAGTCLYTNTPDHHFVIDCLPGHSNVVFFTGCSGHAFKFAPVIAEMMINLLEKKTTPPELFSLSRCT